MLFGMRRVHRQVYQHPSLHPNRPQGEKLLLCCQGRIHAGLVQSHALRHCWRYRHHHHVPRKTTHRHPHSPDLLPSGDLHQLSPRKIYRAYDPSGSTFVSIQLVAVIAYLVGVLFMSVYSIAMDTLLQCFIVDE